MNKNEAMKLAIEALNKLTEAADGFSVSGVYFNEGTCEQERLNNSYEAIKALEEALAKQEQEPVAWVDIDEKGAVSGLRYWSEPDNRHEVALYTTPQRTWVGLTSEDYNEIFEKARTGEHAVKLAENKLKEKNT